MENAFGAVRHLNVAMPIKVPAHGIESGVYIIISKRIFCLFVSFDIDHSACGKQATARIHRLGIARDPPSRRRRSGIRDEIRRLTAISSIRSPVHIRAGSKTLWTAGMVAA